MEQIPPRMLIFPRDIENITGTSGRTSRRIAEKIKRYYNKAATEYLTVEEFCTYMKLEEKVVRKYLGN